MLGLDYLYTFLQSNLLEVVFVIWFLRKSHSPLYLLCFVSMMNSLTHPWVFFFWMGLPLSYLCNILLAEAFAIGAETLIYQKFLEQPLRRGFVLSLLANLISWQVGPALTWIFWHSHWF